MKGLYFLQFLSHKITSHWGCMMKEERKEGGQAVKRNREEIFMQGFYKQKCFKTILNSSSIVFLLFGCFYLITQE